MELASVTEIIDEIRQGRMVVLVDDEDRENEGDLILAAEFVTPEAINFMARHARGLICLTLTEERCRQLNLPLMTQANGTRMGTNFTLSIEAAEGVSTGISAHDRALTIRTAVAPRARPSDIVQPGHVFPVMARDGGVLMRAGHTEAGCDLPRMAGLTPAAVICEVMNEDGTMARMPDLMKFAQTHGLKLGTIADLIQHRSAHESLIERVVSHPVMTPYGPFQMLVYRDAPSAQPHIALVVGDPSSADEVAVRVHEPLTPTDWLSTDTTGHSWSLPRAMAYLAGQPCGVLVMLNCAPDSAAVFASVQRWMQSAASTPGTVPAPAERPVPPRADTAAVKPDLRIYGIGAQILRDLGVRRMRLLAQPRRIPSMAGYGLDVTGFIEYGGPTAVSSDQRGGGAHPLADPNQRTGSSL